MEVPFEAGRPNRRVDRLAPKIPLRGNRKRIPIEASVDEAGCGGDTSLGILEGPEGRFVPQVDIGPAEPHRVSPVNPRRRLSDLVDILWAAENAAPARQNGVLADKEKSRKAAFG